METLSYHSLTHFFCDLFSFFTDPHDPYDVRPPYGTMYNNLTFDVPDTAIAALGKEPALPNWAPPSNLKKFIGKKWN